MKKDIRNKIVIAGACIIVCICIAGFPREMFSEENHSSEKSDVAKGIEMLENIEANDIYEIESQIQSVRNSIETGKQQSGEEEDSEENETEEQKEKDADRGNEEETINEPAEEAVQTVLEAEQSEDEPGQIEQNQEQNQEQNPVAEEYKEEQTPNESNVTGGYAVAGLDVESYNYKEIFANSVVMGDSISEGLDSFDMLNSSSVIAKVGVSLVSLDGALATVTQLSPQNVFLYYGLNDVGHVKYDYDRFRDEYESFLVRLKEALPNANIYVNLLFPVNDWTLIGPWYDNLDPYNEVIADMCARYGVVCLDNRDIVREEYYVSDGYHFNRAFYPQWLYRMAVGAGLIQ